MTRSRFVNSPAATFGLAAIALALAACGSSSDGATGPSGPSGPAATPIASDVTAGMAALQTSLTSHSTDDIVTAATALDTAARNAAADTTATEGQRNQAYFFGAAARMALLSNPYPNAWPAAMNTIGDVFDAYGFGGTRAQRSKLETIQFTDCTSGTCRMIRIPATSPRTVALQGFLYDKVLPELQEAATRLGKVTATFQATITYGSRKVSFDRTDALFLKGVAEAAIAAIQIQKAYDLDVDLSAAQNGGPWTADSFFAANPTFLRLKTASGLPAARAGAVTAVQTMKQAVASLKAETGDQADHFIKLTSTRCTYANFTYTCTTVYNPPDQIASMESSLDMAAAALAASGPYTTTQNGGTVTFVPDAFFAGVDLRAKLPTSVYVGAPMPDPTLGGVLVSPTLTTFPDLSWPFGRPF